jgi:2-polyprenyl-3-methyl-5-hydroxy-6-metoxy-1,4-benzoquinol methylase
MFYFLLRATRMVINIVEAFFGLFYKKDRIDEKYAPVNTLQKNWSLEYSIWEKNRNRFLPKAQPRACPACGSKNYLILWKSEDGYTYVQCRNCDFVFVTPFISYKLWRYYFKHFSKDAEFVNRKVIDSRFDQEYLKEDRDRFSHYLRLLRKYRPEGSVLDVGCLTGSFLKFSQELGYRPLGVEYRPYAIEMARRHFNIEMIEGFFEEVAPAMIRRAQRFDIITFWETLEHMLYPSRALKYCNQMLNAGGLVAISVPNFDNLQVKVLKERCFHCIGGAGNAGHINMFTPTTLQEMLAENGFEVVVMETEGSSNYFDVLLYLSGRYDLIYSYGNTFLPPRPKPSVQPYFFPPAIMNFLLSVSPVFRVFESSLMKGAIILAIARKKAATVPRD